MYRFITFTGLVLFLPFAAYSQQAEVLTLETALVRARQTSPAVVAARMRIDESRGRLVGASLLLSSNPTIDAVAGRRSGTTRTADYAVDIAQDLDLPTRRRARIDATRAVVAQETQRARDIERVALRDVATAFLRAIAARERGEAAAAAKRLAEEALRIAERRFAAGDVAQLDVNLSRTAVAREEAEVRVATAALTAHVTELRVLLAIPATLPVTLGGSLRESVGSPDVLSPAPDRPDLRVLEAEIAEAEAEYRLARTLRWPDFGLRASYSQEEGDRIILGGVGVSIPLFNRGQESSAVATARLNRLRAERDALARSIEAEVRGAAAEYDALRAAAAEYERTVLPLIEENERLVLESYDIGQIGLADLLLVRRDSLDARRALIDQLIATRLAEVELRTRAGVWK